MEQILDKKTGMIKYHEINNIRITDDKLKIIIDLQKYEFGLKRISTKLSEVSEQEKKNFKISPSGYGIHWPMIDEDISIDGLLRQKIRNKKKPVLIK